MPHSKPSLLKYILFAGLIAGTLDMSGAMIVWSFILQKLTPAQLLHGIASGVFGAAAKNGGQVMAMWGLLFHYVIAFSFTAGFFLVYPHAPILSKSILFTGIFYGTFAWAFMKYVVLVLFHVRQAPFRWDYALLSIAILVVCIGIPLSLLARKYYNDRSSLQP